MVTISVADAAALAATNPVWAKGLQAHAEAGKRPSALVVAVAEASIAADAGTATPAQMELLAPAQIPDGVDPAKVKRKRRGVLNLHTCKVNLTEAQRQGAAVDLLRAIGYSVLVLGEVRPIALCLPCSRKRGSRVIGRCPECHKAVYSPDTGNTPGAPDTMVSHVRWPPLSWAAIEWKRAARSARRDAQKALVEAGRSIMVTSERECIEALIRYERDIVGIEPLPALGEQLAQLRREMR
jgi:hypothetical protein